MKIQYLWVRSNLDDKTAKNRICRKPGKIRGEVKKGHIRNVPLEERFEFLTIFNLPDWCDKIIPNDGPNFFKQCITIFNNFTEGCSYSVTNIRNECLEKKALKMALRDTIN